MNQEIKNFFNSASTYLEVGELDSLKKAYLFGESAHKGQFRKSGDPYITHPICVATILTEWRLDVDTLKAAILHDVVEDTLVTKNEIKTHFGPMVADLVDGVSKLDKITFESKIQQQAENFRKMLLAMSQDVRVILIKLADRLHNMRTINHLEEKKKTNISKETFDIYAPIANRLGLNNVFQELQDLSFINLYPNRYNVLTKAVLKSRGNRKEIIQKILFEIKKQLTNHKINAEVSGREKNIYSIYKKMQMKALSFTQILDIYGFRVTVKNIQKCYLTLGALHQLYKPKLEKFKDYISIPKNNGYQSLHTTLIGPFGMALEVQIRTHEMHKIAETGVASHWLYKDTGISLTNLQIKTHQWLQNLLELQAKTGNSAEFLKNLKVDLFPEEIYVFTPKGEILTVPFGSTCLDFAYHVHTDIGNKTVSAKINHEIVPLRTELKSGDHVEIITAAHARPNYAWLKFVVTGRARTQIRHLLKTLHFDEAVSLGKRLLNHSIKELDNKLTKIPEKSWKYFLNEKSEKNKLNIYADIGLGKQHSIFVARKLLSISKNQKPTSKKQENFVIHGSDGIAIHFSQCCKPIPGDPIIGIIKKGFGLKIHTHDCIAVRKANHAKVKWIDVEWAKDIDKLFTVSLKMIVKNKSGVVARLTTVIASSGSNIEKMSASHGDSIEYGNIMFALQVKNRMHLASLLKNLRKIEEVIRISRVKSSVEDEILG